MSRWIEQFKTHPFNADWSRLNELLSAPLSDERNASVGIAQEYARLRKVVAYVRGILENVDPELLSSSFLGGLHSHVQNTINEITAFNSNGSTGHLQNANANVDHLLVMACQNPFTALANINGGLTRAATEYAESLDRHATSYAMRTDDLVSGAEQKLTALGGQVATANEQVTKLDSRVVQVETAVQAQLSSFNSTFQTSEATRAGTFETWLTSFQGKAVDDYAKLIEQNAKGLLAMQSFQDDAERVLGTVIDTAQAGAYAKYANEEKNSANLYRLGAIASMGAAALVLFAPEFMHWLQQGASYIVDWKLALYRLPFSVVLFAPALYLAKESSRHRTNEVLNRRRQHILTTIGPYLALLPDDKANAIKADVAKNIFSENLVVAEDKTPDAGLIALLSQALSMAKK